MILGIILTVLFVGLIVFLNKFEFDNWEFDVREFFASIGAAIIGFWLLIHVILISTTSYTYESFVEKRNAFETTLNTARENGRELESATIMKEVSEWNVYLASYKYENNHWYLGQYVDDRFDDLKPIK